MSGSGKLLHASTTDTDARLFRKGPGKEARLVFMGHALMENRNGKVMRFNASGRHRPAKARR
jgi:hypothetical protein